MTYFRLLGWFIGSLVPAQLIMAIITELGLRDPDHWEGFFGLSFFIAFVFGVLFTWRHPISRLLKLLNEIAEPEYWMKFEVAPRANQELS